MQSSCRHASASGPSFEELRRTCGLYVDKTAYVYELARERSKVFLARPEGFGKTLLLSTFESLFAHGLRDFHALDIEDLWTDEGRYTVLRLDLSGIPDLDNADRFEENFDRYLSDVLALNNLKSPISCECGGYRAFSGWLRAQPINSVVLLIDECDAPFMPCFGDESRTRKVGSMLSRFYAVLKESEGRLRFLFLTGVTRVGYEGMIDCLNYISDISIYPDFGTMLGFDEREVRACFGERMAEIAKEAGVSTDEILSRLRSRCGGYVFDEDASTSVFRPLPVLESWRILNDGFDMTCLAGKVRTEALIKCLRMHSVSSPDVFDKPASVTVDRLHELHESSDVSLVILLTETGLWTNKGKLNPREFEVGFPNEDARRAAVYLCAEAVRR